MGKKWKVTKTKMYDLISDYLTDFKIEYLFDVPLMRECRYKKLCGYHTYILDFDASDYYVKCLLSSGMGSGYMRIQLFEFGYGGKLLKEKFIQFSWEELYKYGFVEECA